jgi:serine/threonine protein phosphatase PrpC
MKNDRTGTITGNGLSAAARTDRGRQRDGNEDRYFIDLQSGIFLVIDGVGGHAAGEVAARIANETIQKRLERQDGTAAVRVREAITLANQQILLQASESPQRKGMACVLTLAVLEGRRLTIGHVGDTRLYRFSAEGIAKMTHDHSPVGEREDARELSETEAMQHARRNEVYRDVGSEPREPDAADFIEIVVTTLDEDVALLLCSDGLSDMLPSLEINRLVRAQAGDPARVADALVDAANQAGGKDNITVVYVEGPRFARSAGAPRVVPMLHQAPQQVATEALDGFDAAGLAPAPTPPARPLERTKRPRRSFLRSRALALAAGVAIGVAGEYALVRWPVLPWPIAPPATANPAPRELVVGGTSPGAYLTFGAAHTDARAGDTIRVQPGRYAEQLELRRGVTIVSDLPHAAVLVAPDGAGAWASVTVWSQGNTLRGFRVSNGAGAGRVGVRVHTGAIEIDDVVFDGALEIGLDVVGAGSRAIARGSRFMGLSGVPVQVGEGAFVTLRQNLFRAAQGTTGPAVACASAQDVALDANVFMHFGRTPVAAAAGPAVIVDPAYTILPPVAPRGRPR